MSFQLNVALSAADVQAIKSKNQKIILVRLSNAQLAVVWASVSPSEKLKFEWSNNALGAYTSGDQARPGVQIRTNEVSVQGDKTRYEFRNGRFDPRPDGQLRDNSLIIINNDHDGKTMGVVQTIRVNNDQFEHAPILAQVLYGNMQTMAQVENKVAIFVSDNLTAGKTLEPQFDNALIVDVSKDGSVNLKFNATTSKFEK
jgi:hypothetical protein